MNRYGKHSVSVVLNNMKNKALLPFRCIFCTCLMFKFSNRVVYVIVDDPGVNIKDLGENESMKEHKCRGCNTTYQLYTNASVELQEDYDRQTQGNSLE